MRETALSIMKQALTILQLFTISQLGCGSKEFQRNLLKRTTKNSHWGYLKSTFVYRKDFISIVFF